MKIKHVMILLITLVLLTQSVSASFFEDVYDKITGKTTEEVEEDVTEEPALEPEPVPEVPPDVPEEPVVVEPELCPPIPINRWCPDRKTLCPMKTDEMGCSDWDCDACEPISEEKIICCKTWPVVPNPTYSYTWKAENECPPLQEGLPPVGEGYEIVSNEYCEEESKPPEPEPVPEVSPTEIVRICAAKIKITFDKEVYYYGDDFKLVVEIFDSQGNHIPYYSFYAQMYTYHNGMWHTPDEDKTAKDGYFINKGKIEEGKQALGKVKIKVYTSSTGAYADCDSVEDIIETEIRKGEEKEVCGIGVCVPEEVAEIKEIPEEKILYSCMGCELKGKCYPMGYRKEGKYCSDDYEFVAQIKDGECDNSFECKSNVCISGECVSESLLQKIISWFKRLSGIEPEPEPPKPEVDCSELLIEKDIGKYEYTKSGYGDTKESQAPLISDKGEQIGTIKCCLAQYLDQNEMRGMALVCPYKNREYVENLVKIGLKQAPGAEFILEDYKGEEVYVDKWISMVWVHENYAVAAGRDYQQEGSVFPEDIADAYLEKYPNDLGEIDIFGVEEEETEAILEETTQNADGCGGITDSDARDECYYIIARENKDVSLCEKITYSDSKDGCYNIIAIETKDINLCREIKYSSLKDHCYLSIAKETQDASLCEEDSNIQEQCYRDIALATKNGILCDKVGVTRDYDLREGCYFSVATKTKDLALCDKITVIEPYRDACYALVTAIIAKNASMCETYPGFDGNGIDFCYFTFAIETKNATSCERITDSSIKERCYELVQEE